MYSHLKTFKKSQMRTLVLIFFFVFIIFELVFSFQGGDGSLGNPYQISNCSELQNMSSNVNANYSLISNVDCGISPYNVSSGFLPVGNLTAQFKGNFNGNDYSIQNLFINRSGVDYVGLFGIITSSEIYDVSLISVDILGKNNVGGMVGFNLGNISNSSVSGNVGGGDTVGGMVGNNLGFINNSYSSATINGSYRIGGIVGYNTGPINNSYATGVVRGNDRIGGFVGDNNENVDNCYASGDVIATGAYIGGFVGYANNYKYIRKSYASGDVSGNWSIGGFVGRAFTSFISDSYASGDVSGNLNIGGFVGQLSGAGSEIQNSFATGNVNGNTSVGGFAGTNSQIINNSYSTGNVDAVLINWGGGFAGYNSGILLNSFWNNVSGNSNISIGNDTNAQIVTTIQNDISWFYNSSNPPMINWTSSIWYFSGSGFPQLAWTVPSSPTSIAGIFPIMNPVMLILVFLSVLFALIFS